jgi:hypothetical protein
MRGWKRYKKGYKNGDCASFTVWELLGFGMGKRHTTLWVAVGVVGVALGSFLGFTAMRRSARETRYYSAMEWLAMALSEGLQAHYADNGKYPDKLGDVTVPFPGDHAKPEMLREFRYTTDGESYEMTWTVRYGGQLHTHREIGRKGRKVLNETHRED